jgi:prepilin-type N-terminal cleavage/methylation domain-containing protein
MRAGPMQRVMLDSRARRGFTLVELMVAMVAGLFVSIAVFTLAKHASAFAMRQSRVADATLQSVIGFERMKADIARAGFLSTPNVARDPTVCRDGLDDPSYPAWLKRIASVHIEAASDPSPESTLNGLSPKSLVLAGSYDAFDQFVARNVTQDTPPVVFLSRTSLGMANIGYEPLSGGDALGRVFKSGRALRIADDAGGVQFARISSVAGGENPTITLAEAPGVQFRGSSLARCGVRGHGNDFVNPVNFIRYDIRSLSTGHAELAKMYRGGPSYESTRRELVREEIDLDGAPDPSTLELIAEYAVDLDFSLLVAPSDSGPLVRFSGADVDNYAGNIEALPVGNGPQLIRAVHAWLSLRSQEADRPSALPFSTTTPGPNLLRISVNPTDPTQPPFARVRTLQSTIPLPNQSRTTWR